MLWGCDVVQRFIKDVEAHLTSRFSIVLNANKETWFFPRLPSEDTLKILMITLAKRAILRSKYMNLPPSMSLFLSLLRAEASVERNAAVRRQTLDKYETKWGRLGGILEE